MGERRIEFITSHGIEMGHYQEYLGWINSYMESNPYARTLPRYTDTVTDLKNGSESFATHVATLNSCTKSNFDGNPYKYIALYDYLLEKCILPA